MRVTVTARKQLTADLREYAEEKLRRLERHANLHEVSLVIDRDSRRIPEAAAEVVVHIHHTRLAARAEAGTAREAIDKVVDKADEQIRRRKERVGNHKGRVGADAEPPRRHGGEIEEPGHGPGGVIHERRARLRPMTAEAAIAELERRDLAYLLFLDEAGGDIALVSRRHDDGYDLVFADTR